jgi:hypothetical protein
MTCHDTLIVTLLGVVAAGFFLRAFWLRWTPRAPDGCWLKRPGFNGPLPRRSGTRLARKRRKQKTLAESSKNKTLSRR